MPQERDQEPGLQRRVVQGGVVLGGLVGFGGDGPRRVRRRNEHGVDRRRRRGAAPAAVAEAPAPADDASDIDSLEMDELDGVLGDKEAPLLFNEELLRIALRVCRKKLRVLVDDDTELDGGSGYDRLVTDLEWEALRHAQGRVDCSLALPKDMPPTLDESVAFERRTRTKKRRGVPWTRPGPSARAREDKLERIRKAELTERRKEARRNLMRAPSPLKDDLRKDIEAILDQLGETRPAAPIERGARLDEKYLDRQARRQVEGQRHRDLRRPRSLTGPLRREDGRVGRALDRAKIYGVAIAHCRAKVRPEAVGPRDGLEPPHDLFL